MIEALGHYKILERIGAGGLGDVYRARDTRLGRTVAVKVPSGDFQSDASRRDALRHDGRAVQALSHPNIATLYEVGEEDGSLFVVSEFAPGETLTRTIAGLPMNARRAVDLASQIADALADAHATDIVHGNLRPDTVIVTPKGNAKILDFGLSRWSKAAAGHTTADDRADVAALGRLLFEMLTGKRQAGGETPSMLNPSLPKELDAIVSKATAGGDGHPAAATVAAELRSIAAILDVRASTEAVRVVPARGRSRRPVRWREPWVVVAGIVAFAALAGAMWWLF